MIYEKLLTDLGFDDVEDLGDTMAFSDCDYCYEIDKEDLDESDDYSDVVEKSMKFSTCCGAELDDDYDICSECGEHC